MKNAIILVIFRLVISIALFVGEVKCIIKAVNCDWNPIGKSEIIYTGASLTGLGVVVGYIDIEDN